MLELLESAAKLLRYRSPKHHTRLQVLNWVVTRMQNMKHPSSSK